MNKNRLAGVAPNVKRLSQQCSKAEFCMMATNNENACDISIRLRR